MRQYAHTRFFLALILTLAVWTLTCAPALAAVVHATYTFTDFTTRALSVKRVTVTPLASSADYAGAQLSNKPLIYSAPTYYTLTNGSITISNLVCGYAYKVAFSDGYSEPVITNYFGTNIATGTVVDANDYKTTYINFVNGSIIQVWYAYLSNTNSSGTSGALTNNDTRAVAFDTSLTIGAGSAANSIHPSAGLLTFSNSILANGSYIKGHSIIGTNFVGNGASLTNLHGSNSITAGTIDTNRMDATAYVAFKNDVTQAELAAGSYAINGALATNINATNLIFPVSGNVTVKDYFVFQTTNSSPGTLGFSSTVHLSDGLNRGVVWLGMNYGDVVVGPSGNSGIFQIGSTAISGSYTYLQYAETSDATYTNGYSHPLEFRSRSYLSGTNYYHYPGIVGFPSYGNADGLGQLVFYAKAPHWNTGNRKWHAPDIAGTEVLRVSTNGVTAAGGLTFNVGTKVGQTVTVVVLDSTTNALALNFTGGILTSTGYDTNAQNFFDASGITDNAQRSAINSLVLSLKSSTASLWTKMQVIYPFVGGTSNTHSWNLKDTNAFRVAWTTTGVTHDANGITGNGSSGYGNTQYTPSTSGSLNSSHVSVYCRTTTPSNNSRLLDVTTGLTPSSRFGININTTFISAELNDITYTSVPTSTDFRGFLAGSRTGASATGIINRNSSASGSITSTSLATSSVFLLARNWPDYGTDAYTTANLAFASIGSGLSVSELEELRTIVNTFQSALLRNVP